MVMDVDSMRSMYSQYLFQQKQVVYLEAVKKDLQISLSQLKNTAEIPKVTKAPKIYKHNHSRTNA